MVREEAVHWFKAVVENRSIKDVRLLYAALAEQVQGLYGAYCPGDTTARKAIRIAKSYAGGDATADLTRARKLVEGVVGDLQNSFQGWLQIQAEMKEGNAAGKFSASEWSAPGKWADGRKARAAEAAMRAAWETTHPDVGLCDRAEYLILDVVTALETAAPDVEEALQNWLRQRDAGQPGDADWAKLEAARGRHWAAIQSRLFRLLEDLEPMRVGNPAEGDRS